MRTLQFWDSHSEQTGNLVKEVTPHEGDLLIMNVGCQSHLWHKVLNGHSTTGSPGTGPRYALSFRKLKIAPQVTQTLVPVAPVVGSSPEPTVTVLSTGFLVDSTRAIVANKPKPTPPTNITEHENNLLGHNTNSGGTERNQQPLAHKHVIIGDSMVNSLRVPGSINLFKGGIGPDKVLQLLPSYQDVLPPAQYDEVQTLTLVVGTNALYVRRPNTGMLMLDVVFDYEKLVYNLRKLFPNARIGLYNVLPRSSTCPDTRRRIEMFNDIFSEHVAPRLKSVYWINHYHEFLDQYGNLREDLYVRSGVRLKNKGKALMARVIRNFQIAYS